MEVGSASSSVPDAEATSAAPTEWVLGGGTAVLNKAAQDIQAKLKAEATALQQCTRAFLASLAAIRVRLLFLFLILVFFRGGAPAHPLGVAPSFGSAAAQAAWNSQVNSEC